MKLEQRLEIKDFIVTVSIESTSVKGHGLLSDVKDRLQYETRGMASALASAMNSLRGVVNVPQR